MNKREVIERILKAIQSKQWNASAVFGGANGTSGSMNVMQADVNKAITAWLEANDSAGIREITSTLHVVGSLNDEQYEQIMKAIDGEKE